MSNNYQTRLQHKTGRLVRVRIAEYKKLKQLQDATGGSLSMADLMERAMPYLETMVLPTFLEEAKEGKFDV